MAELLVHQLYSIDSIPDSIEVDKGKEIRKVFEERRRKNPTLDRVIKGETSFSKIVEDLSKKYQGWRAYLPVLGDREYERKLDELKLDESLHTGGLRTPKSYFDKIWNAIANPPVNALLFGALGVLLSIATPFPPDNKYYAIRDLINYLTVAGCMIAGGIIGLSGSWSRQSRRNLAMDNAEYLDKKIQEIYRS